MYKKKKILAAVAAAVVVILAAVFLIGMNLLKKNWADVPETETEEPRKMHEVLLYKSSAGVIEFHENWLISDAQTESILSIEDGTLVQLIVTEKPGKILEEAQVLDYSFHEISSMVHEGADGKKRVDFVMPEADVIVNFTFKDQTEETEAAVETEKESETETDQEAYEVTIHGLSAEIITSYDGLFDDREFIQQLGDSLKIGDPTSQYCNVTDVTFAEEEVPERDQSEGVVSHYIYFNEDEEWKMLTSFYKNGRSYLFMEYQEPETETIQDASEGTNWGSYGTSGGGGAVTIETSFDIMQVSKTFLSYTGDDDTFYSRAFEYVLEKGLTGKIVGTMSSYEIRPEEGKAVFKIALNVGGSITGEYDKKKNTYSFAGL